MTLFEAFLSVEERFQRGSEATEQEIIDDLRQAWAMLVNVCAVSCNTAAFLCMLRRQYMILQQCMNRDP